MKAIFQYLLKKPPVYLQVWAFLYANTDESGVFEISIYTLLSRFKISQTTLHRIVQLSDNWNESGMKVERKWNNNTLKIKVLEGDGGMKVERKWNRSGMKKKASSVPIESNNADYQPSGNLRVNEPPEKLYPQMVKLYDDFCRQRINVGAKMDALQGKSMKSIIDFLSAQIKTKKGSNLTEQELNEGIKTAWSFILSKWDLVKGYYSEQIKLSQINANLPNILMQMKSNNQNNRDAKFSNIENQIGNVNFE